MLQATGYPAAIADFYSAISGGGGDSRGEGGAAPIGKNEFKLRLFMLLTFKLIKIFLDLTQWVAKVAIVHKIRE